MLSIIIKTKLKTRRFLYHLLWSEGGLATGLLSGINEAHAYWGSRLGFGRQVGRWKAEGIVETVGAGLQKERFIRLTQEGRLAALGGRDPQAAWARPWDGLWRLVIFDIPRHDSSLRKVFIRGLKECGCGCLQGSVWISPDFPSQENGVFEERGQDCSHFMILESSSQGKSVDSKMVAAAWDFAHINRLYQKELSVLQVLESGCINSLQALLEWGEEENEAWQEAVSVDPLLPVQLLPRGYRGREVWKVRRRTLRKAGELMALLAPTP